MSKSINPTERVFFWNGLAVEFGKDVQVSITPRADRIETVIGCDGNVVHVYKPEGDRVYDIVLTLMETSPYNGVLSALCDAGIMESSLVWVSDTDNFTGKGVIMKRPSKESGGSVGEVQWAFTGVGKHLVTGKL